jgi:hypothetical protein
MRSFRNPHRSLPCEFARLESVEGGILVRFVIVREQKCDGGPDEPGEEWRSKKAHTHPFAVPTAIFCDTPDKLVKAIDRARAEYEKLNGLDDDVDVTDVIS